MARGDALDLEVAAAWLEHSVDAVISIDEHGTILSFNRGAERMFGYLAHEVLGANVRMLMPEPYQSEHDQYLARYLRTGERRIIGIGREVEGRRADGTIFPLDLAVSEAQVGGRRIFTAIAKDLTDRNRAIQALRDSEALLRSVVDTAVDAIITIDEYGTIETFNAGAERMFGYSSSEVLGENVCMLMPEPYRSEHDQYLARYLRTGERRIIGIGREVEGRRADGTIFPLDLAVSEVVVQGRRLFTGIARDLTERKKAAEDRRAIEEQLLHAQRFESLGRLAGGVAHDFNNLLTVVLTAAEAMQAHAAGDPVVHQELARIERAARRGAELTRQLLAISRTPSSEQRTVDLRPLVEELRDLLSRVLEASVELRVDVASDVWAVHGDATQLQQVLLNLAVNARDAMPAGGVLTIAAENAKVAAGDPDHPTLSAGDYVRLTVSDTGTGMPPEVAAHAFEPFFSTKGSTESSGLGLAIVYGVVTGFGGSVRLDSEPGGGTTVEMLLPAGELVTPAPERLPPTARRGSQGETILLVEDDSEVLASAAAILRAEGYDVIATPDPLKALTALDTGVHVDLVLTDVVLPGMSGLELADAVVSGHIPADGPPPPVGLVSGYGEAETGEHPVLAKPFSASSLIRFVTALLEHRTLPAP